MFIHDFVLCFNGFLLQGAVFFVTYKCEKFYLWKGFRMGYRYYVLSLGFMFIVPLYAVDDSLERTKIFYDKKNPFFRMNDLFNRSQYAEAIVACEDILDRVIKGFIQASNDQLKLAKNVLGQAYRAVGDLEKGYMYISEAMNHCLKKPLTKERFDEIIRMAEKNELQKKPKLLIHGADTSRRFGIGDMFIDGIYAKKVSDLGCFETVEVVLPSVKKIHENARCADDVITTVDALPDDYDYEVMLFSLPHFLDMKNPYDIPQESYIRVDENRCEFWEKEIAKITSNGEVPILFWWETSNFPTPEGRLLLQRKVPLKFIADIASRNRGFKFISIQTNSTPVTHDEFQKLTKEEQGLNVHNVISQEQKNQIEWFSSRDDFDKEPFADTFALAKVVMKCKKGFTVGPDTALPNGIARAVARDPEDIHRICMLMPFHSDARYGIQTPGVCEKVSRIPNCVEFWQDEENSWTGPIGNVEKYILKNAK